MSGALNQRPRLLIDVDGVINAFGRPKRSRRTIVGPYEIAVPSGTIGRLRRMIKPFDPIWATTWAQHAPVYISPLIGGIGADWDFIEFPYLGLDPRVKRTWKLEGLLAWAEREENSPPARLGRRRPRRRRLRMGRRASRSGYPDGPRQDGRTARSHG